MRLAPRHLRIAIGVAVITAAIMAFAGSVAMIPQMGSSVLNAVATGAATAIAVVLFFTVLTLLFGRVYCAALCPFGIVQDFIAWLTRRKGRPDKNRKVLRYSILAITVGILLAGWVMPARALEPFTLFGRMVSGFVIPVFAKIVPGADGKYVSTEAGIAAGMVVLLALVVLVVRRKRVFCTSICPVGALLGLFAKVGVFRLSMDSNACIHCGKCVKLCPAGCIDLKRMELDNERCVRCMNCISTCPKNAVKLKRHTFDKPEPAVAATVPVETPPRRKFLFGLGGVFLASFGAGRLLKPGGVVPLHIKPGIFPPGAGSMERFSSKCTGCLLCLSGCSGKVIMPPDANNPTVHLDYTKGMCEFNCNNCSQVCPTGAIMSTPLEKKKRLRIGIAVFYEHRCIAAVAGTHCGACAEHCPTGALRMVLKPGHKVPIPELTEELCIGCGNCSWPCPAIPERAITVSPVPVQTLAEDPEEHFKKIQEQLTTPPASTGEWLI